MQKIQQTPKVEGKKRRKEKIGKKGRLADNRQENNKEER